MDDDYLASFLSDIRSVLYAVFSAVEFTIGVSYFCGKQLAGAIFTSFLFIWDLLCEASVWMGYLIEEIVELEKFLIRCLLLVYFGFGQIIEAFYITFQDLKTFSEHFAESVAKLCYDGYDAIVHSACALTFIPDQLWSALGIVGDFAVTSAQNMGLLVADFAVQLIKAPLNVLFVCGKIILSVLQIPVLLFRDISVSSILGISVLTALYYMFYKKLVHYIINLVWVVVKWIWREVGRVSSQLYSLIFRNRSIQDDDNSFPTGKPTKGICVVCQENPVIFIAQPCKHVCLCRDCVRTLVDFDRRCPMCRRPVQQYERVYIS